MNDHEESASDRWTLACHGVSLDRGSRRVLHDVALTLRAGECTAIVGPNGAGKTTLLLSLIGVLPPTTGQVTLNSQDIRRLPARQRGRFVAYVPQVLDVSPAFSVQEIVEAGRYPHAGALGTLGTRDRESARTALAICGLTELAPRRFDTLSGGERQKTMIAAAIAQEPRLLALDEPTTALDPAYQAELVRILRSWHAPHRGLLVVSHDLVLPAVLGGRVVALRDGRVAVDGPAEQVLTPETLSQVYGARFASVRTREGREISLPQWWHEP
jgi:iron complex transport system ATP-binding protein